MSETTARAVAKKPESILDQTRSRLKHLGLRARKGLGQHFLVDEEVLKRIISSAALTPADVVMEIGPGLGILTRELAARAGWVIAIELDDNLASALKKSLKSFKNVTVINQDILEVEPESVLRELQPGFPPAIASPPGYRVVANLPYYITSPVLRHFLEAPVKPQSILVMVQKEVAKAIAAEPGEMSILSIAVQLYGKPSIVGYVPASSFYPAPEVDSAILKIDVYPAPAVAVEEKSFFELVRAGFSAARKQIGNSLAHRLGIPKADVLSLLEKAGISPESRAEALTLDEWSRLWREFTAFRR